MISTVRHTPMMRLLIPFIFGILLAGFGNVPLAVLFGMSLLLLLLSLVLKKSDAVLFSLLIIAGMLRYSFWNEQLIRPEMISVDSLKIDIMERHDTSLETNYYIARSKTDEITFRFILRPMTGQFSLQPGKQYLIKGVDLQSIQVVRNPYQFNYQRYMRNKGVSHEMVKYDNLVSHPQNIFNPLLYYSQKMRYDISDHLVTAYGFQKGELLSGLFLGLKEQIAGADRQLFQNLGISHVLAVSGLHVGFIVMIVLLISDLLRLRSGNKVLFTITVMILYAWMSGLSPSVIRAVVMTSLFLSAPILKRKPDAMNSLFATAFILLLAKPSQLYDTGFQFSFTAVLGILLIYPKLRSFYSHKITHPIMNYLNDILLVSVAASLATAPLTIIYFHTLPFLSIFLNLLIIPLTFLLITILILALPFLYVGTFTAIPLLYALDAVTTLFMSVTELANAADIWLFSVNGARLWLLATIFSGIILLILQKPAQKLVTIIVLFAAVIGWQYFIQLPELIAFSGRGAPVLLLNSGEYGLLINTGIYTPFEDQFTSAVEPALDHFNPHHLAILLTENKTRNRANLDILNENYTVDRLLEPDQKSFLDTLHWGKFTLIQKANNANQVNYLITADSLRLENHFLFTRKNDQYEQITASIQSREYLLSTRKSELKNHTVLAKSPAFHWKYFFGKWHRLSP